MNILYIATSFPTVEKGSTIYTDLAEALVENGHNMTVVVSEEKRNTKKTKLGTERGCKVLRVKTGNYYNVSLIEKGLTFITMKYRLILGIKQHLINEKFDLILFESPPVTNVEVIKYAKKVFGAKTYLMLKDIFPQNAVDLGIIRENGFLNKYYRRKEKLLYSIADSIGTMSEGNKEYLLNHNKELVEKKVGLFPNTKKIIETFPSNGTSQIREKYGINKHASLFLFGGNMGKPQAIPFLCEAILNLKHEQDIFFLLIGRGTETSYIKKFINENNLFNAILMENLPRHEYEEVLEECDVGIVLLDHRFTIPNFPSRILSYMEYAKPVVSATDKVTDYRKLLEESGCGLWCESNDVSKFCDNITFLHENKKMSIEMGENGRRYIEENLSISKCVEILEKF